MYMRHLIFALFLTAALLGGCGSAKPKGPRVDVTIGQQLIELKEAHAAGALNDAEYARQRKALIDNMQ